MNIKKHISLIMTMLSTLIIVAHGIVPHHHAETIELCDGHSISHLHSAWHTDHDTCTDGCEHLQEKECSDEGHLCGQFFAFVNSLSSESSEHFFPFYTLSQGADQVPQPREITTSALCHNHECACCIDDGVFSNLIARRGPPAVC